MRLTYFQGLNCYYECIICIAGYYGLEPAAAFASLWSETDFKYDPYRKAYLTNRMPAGQGIFFRYQPYLL